MSTLVSTTWERFCDFYYHDAGLNFSLDLSRVNLDTDFLARMQPDWTRAYQAMTQLEAGAIANPDEHRMVGHYWLRAPELAPSPEIRTQIEATLERILQFAGRVHSGQVHPPEGSRFTNVLSIGIGGSALGPMFVAEALGSPTDPVQLHFFDNTDPDGIDRVLARIDLETTLILVISKSGGTPETFNGMIEAQQACMRAGLSFSARAVAVTGEGSKLDRLALEEGWLDRFPMWDWVGGRTSELSAVGLLPAALQGIDVKGMLEGAAAMDRLTRSAELRQNPSGMLAAAWYSATGGKGAKDMVILPYKDRLALFSRYLQQLVMESLGKALDLDGNEVHQGIAVYGNKGSTDQHAYVQQLRDGLNNFFATFLVVEKDRSGAGCEVEEGVTAGDYLSGFWQGTREALTGGGRESITLTVPEVSPFTVGVLIALYERAVGYYGSLVNVNAYHQPGVEAGKKAAGEVLKLQRRVVEELTRAGETLTAPQLAERLGVPDRAETVFHICRHLAANQRHGIQAEGSGLAARFGRS
ncbi:MAG: glucose-6-phosphate isomerase [Candidatus Eremiobacterota bacterium]